MTGENLTPRPRFVDLAPSFPPEGPVVREVDRRLVVEYPAGRPEWFACSPGVIEDLVDEVNRLRVALVDAVIDEALVDAVVDETVEPRRHCGDDVVLGAEWVCQPTPCDRPGECPLSDGDE
jgi:hypothetical protein